MYNQVQDSFQVFFRTSKGGCGIEYETAKAELLSVFRDRQTNILLDLPFKMRMNIYIEDMSDDELCRRAERLGYTHGILRAHEEPYLGEELKAQHRIRWYEGWIRIRNKKILLKEIYRQDEEKLLQEAPHRREFYIERNGEVVEATGHRYRRGMSPNDAKFIVNIAELQDYEIILDPFAGIGGIVIECRNRHLRIFASDIDTTILPGIAHISDNKCAISDARKLPFRDCLFDAVITEPPFGTRYRQSVIESLPELCRIVKSKIILLIADDMYSDIMGSMSGSGFLLKKEFALRRHGNLKSHVLRFDTSQICCEK